MDFIKENKITLIICSSLIILSLIITFVLDKTYKYKDDINVTDYLKKYDVNDVVPIYITEEQMAKKYLSEYVKLIAMEPDKAYDLLNPEYKKIRFPSQIDFENYFAELFSDRFFNANVTNYNVFSKGDYKQFYVVDDNNNTFVFNEYSIMNYDVMFDVVTV